MNSALHKTVTVDCTQSHAFEVFTDGIDRWWPSSHRRFDDSTISMERELGGRLMERASDGAEVVLGKVLQWDPPELLAYSWVPGGATGPTHVQVRFVKEGARTRVDIVHSEGDSGLGDDWKTRVKKFDAAWTEVLAALRKHLSSSQQ